MSPATLLHRQIRPTPHYVQEGGFTSLNFVPMPKDQGKLSVDDGDLVTAEGSWTAFTGGGGASAGVASVSKEESASIDLPVEPAPLADNAAHATIDFTALEPNRHQAKAKKLKKFARARGWQFQPAAS